MKTDDMRALIIVILTAVTSVTVLFTVLYGLSPGVNRFRVMVELLVYAIAVGPVVAVGASMRTRAIAGAFTLAGVLTLAVLVVPLLEFPRKELLAPGLTDQDRGFVLAAIGRPDFTEHNIGTARTYGFRSAARPRDLLVVRFTETVDIRDRVGSAEWDEAPAAIASYGLQPTPSREGAIR